MADSDSRSGATPTAGDQPGRVDAAASLTGPATADYFRTFRAFAPLAGLGGTASVGFAFTRFAHPADAFRTPAFADHLATYYLGEPMRFTQERGGRRRSERIGRGCLTFTPAGQDGFWAADGPVEVLQLAFAPGYLDGVAAAAAGTAPRPVGLDNHLGLYDPRLDHAAGLVLPELADPGVANGVYLESLALVVATRVLAAFGPRPAEADQRGKLDPARLKRVTDFLEAHLADPLSLSDLARVACLEPVMHFGPAGGQSGAA